MATNQVSTIRVKKRDNEEILHIADRLASECLAPRAAHYDASATHPLESWRDV